MKNLNLEDKILTKYCFQLKKAIADKHNGDVKNLEVSNETGISRNKLTDLFKNLKKDLNTLEVLSQYYKIIDFKTFVKRMEIIDDFSEKIYSEGTYWASYRLSSTRRIHQAHWKFEHDSVTGGFNVTKKTHNHIFRGKMELSTDFTVSMTLNSEEGNGTLNYVTTIPHQTEELLNGFEIEYVLWDVLFIDGNQQYTSSEVFVKAKKMEISPKLIREETIEFKPDPQSGLPTNPKYYAYNFLTRYSSKSRHYIDNIKINNSPPLLYEHNIFISCPIGSLKGNKKEFLRLKSIVMEITQILVEDFKFKPDNIYCEMRDSDFSDIGNDNRERYFNVRRNILATHFISIIPESIDERNSGVYLEAYLRIVKKMPAYIFYERRRNFPSLLQGIIKDNKAVNVVFEQDFKVAEVPNYLRKRKFSLFDFGL